MALEDVLHKGNYHVEQQQIKMTGFFIFYFGMGPNTHVIDDVLVVKLRFIIRISPTRRSDSACISGVIVSLLMIGYAAGTVPHVAALFCSMQLCTFSSCRSTVRTSLISCGCTHDFWVSSRPSDEERLGMESEERKKNEGFPSNIVAPTCKNHQLLNGARISERR